MCSFLVARLCGIMTVVCLSPGPPHRCDSIPPVASDKPVPSWSISEAATLRLFFAHRSLTAIVFLQCRSQEVDSTVSRAVSKQLTQAPFITSQKKGGDRCAQRFLTAFG